MTMLGASAGNWLGVFRHWCFESFKVFPAVLAEGGSGKGNTSCADTCVAAQNKPARQTERRVAYVFIGFPLLVGLMVYSYTRIPFASTAFVPLSDTPRQVDGNRVKRSAFVLHRDLLRPCKPLIGSSWAFTPMATNKAVSKTAVRFNIGCFIALSPDLKYHNKHGQNAKLRPRNDSSKPTLP